MAARIALAWQFAEPNFFLRLPGRGTRAAGLHRTFVGPPRRPAALARRPCHNESVSRMTPSPAKAAAHDILDDGPAARDEFGPHSRIAGAIAKLVSGRASKGRCIALTGPWGSGKSSVILQLEEQLKESRSQGGPRVDVFLFDAWIHQGDPLRRCFLERLIEFACEPGTDWEEEWKRDLDVNTGRREITTAKQKKPASTLAVMVAISLLVCIPVAGAILGRYDAAKSNFWTNPFSVGAVVLYAIPAVLLIYALWKEGLGGMAASVIRDLRQDTETETVRTREASSTDFRRLFEKVAGRILNDWNRRLVIVIDNLDRVDAASAVNMWTTMRAFFDFGAAEWNQRVWLIVPFDRSALGKLWKTEAAAGDKNGAMTDLSGSFLEKTFQIVFHLSPPVMTQLQVYFEEQMHKAFDDGEVKDHLESVYRIHNLLGPATPSPRQVKSFLNRLRAQTLLWVGKEEECVAIPFLAVHVLKVDVLVENSGALIREDFLSADVINILEQCAPGKDWRQQIAAAHFNVKPDDALQVLLYDRLVAALQTGDFAPLREVRTQPYFWTVFRRHVDTQHREFMANPTALANAVLFAEEPPNSMPPDYARNLWAELLNKAGRGALWRPLDSRKVKAIGILIRHGANAGAVATVVRRMLESVSEVGPGSAAQWVHLLDETLGALRDAAGDALLADFQITVNEPAQLVEANLESIRTMPDSEVWRRFKLKAGVDPAPAYAQAVKELAKYDEFSALRRRVAEATGLGYEALNQAVLGATDIDLDTMLDFLMPPATPPEAELSAELFAKIERFLPDKLSDDPRAAAAIMILASDPALYPQYQDLQATDYTRSAEFVDQIVDTLRSWKRHATLCDPNWNSIDSTTGSSLVKACLTSLLTRNLAAEIPVGPLARLYPQIKQADPTFANSLAQAVAARADLVQAVGAGEDLVQPVAADADLAQAAAAGAGQAVA
jgi:hypothetical protein